MPSVNTIHHGGMIVGIEIKQDANCVFIDRSPETPENEVKIEIEKIKHDISLCISNGYISTDSGVLLQIGKYISRKVTPTPGKMKILGDVVTNNKLSVLKDEGTLGKNNWRFEMARFARDIFSQGIPQDTGVVFMPGSGREEINLWRDFGVASNKTFLIEGDKDKLPQLQKQYTTDDTRPYFISSYLGKGDESFSQELIKLLNGTPVSVLSLDTETSLTSGLIQDLAGVIENISLEKDLFFMLNIVQRGSHKTAKELIQQEEVIDENIINAALEILPGYLIQITERCDIKIHITKVNSYLGGSGTPMHFVFCHMKKYYE